MSVLSEIRDALQSILTRERFYLVSVAIPDIAAADAFDANDAVGGVFPIQVPKGTHVIEQFKLIDPDDDTLLLTAHIYAKRFLGVASDALYTVSADYALDWVTAVTFDGPIIDEGSFKATDKTGINYYTSLDGFLYCQCSTTGTPNIAAGKRPVLQLGIRVF